ncbi:MAG: carbohydrate kinase family protein [Desulfurococcaceae archaeon TW002]
MTRYDVLVFGDLNIDVVMYVSKLPEPDKDIQATNLRIRPGGVGYNVSIALKELGLTPYLIASVGNDVFGQYIIKKMEEAGLEVSSVRLVNGVETGLVSILVLPNGTKAMTSFRGANKHTTITTQDLKILSSVKHVHVSGYTLLNTDEGAATLKILNEASKLGITRSIDLEGVAFSGLDKVLKIKGLTDYVFTNKEELKTLIKHEVLESGSKIHELLKPKTTIVKLSEEGSIAFTSSGIIKQEPYRIKVINCTGAGDAFNAGFIYGSLMSLDLHSILRIANALGARKCCEDSEDCIKLSEVLTELSIK